jgi:hypothetical protein
VTKKQHRDLADPQARRAFEEELLFGEATDTLAAVIESLGITQRELARRLNVSEGRVSQVLSGAENLTLRSLAALGWAIAVRFELNPVAMSERSGTPARGDPPAPSWLRRLQESRLAFGPVSMPGAGNLAVHPKYRVLPDGEVKAA